MKGIELLGNLTPEGIQKLIDDQLARVPGLDRFVGSVTYVPQGKTPPEGWTHMIELVSAATPQKLQVAITGKVPYTLLVDLLLAVF